MKTFYTNTALQAAIQCDKRAGKTIAFVPTMGNLHAGHRQLIRQARQMADTVVVSIFVNPLQFGVGEDFDEYPRTPSADKKTLLAEQVNYLFCPNVDDIYPSGIHQQCKITIPDLSEILCGVSRPGFFSGVATVVNKLFHIVQPEVAIFGKKDFQQLAVIRRMVSDLCMPIKIVGIETVRDVDGLALSSRNSYLNRRERAIAPTIHHTLQECRGAVACGYDDYRELEHFAQEKLKTVGFVPDYFSVRDAHTLQWVNERTQQLVILAAAKLGNTRLIDNVSLMLNDGLDVMVES